MASLPERRPFIRGERVCLRAERSDLPTFIRCWFTDHDGLANRAALQDGG